MQVDVGIVGAGLAGLACAKRLEELGVSYVLFESADRVGGRVQTDRVDGYLLDRGFQVLLDSYPEARQVLRMEELGLRAFSPGALVRKAGRFWKIVDPWRAPLQGLATLRAPFVTMSDALRMAKLRRMAIAGQVSPKNSTTNFLRDAGFSQSLRDCFFRPFFGGVTLDPELSVPAEYFLSLFAWFSKGSATLPTDGMQAIPNQLAKALNPSALRLGQRVRSIESNAIDLESGEQVSCNAVVIATDAASAAKLLEEDRPAPKWFGTTTVYFGAEVSPVGEPILVLNGERSGPVNHLCVLTDAQPSYSPGNAALISVSVLGIPAEGDEELDAQVRQQLRDWYGEQVDSWQRLRVDRIEHALPEMQSTPKAARRIGNLLICGDHVATPSIQGSLESGRLTADAAHSMLGD